MKAGGERRAVQCQAEPLSWLSGRGLLALGLETSLGPALGRREAGEAQGSQGAGAGLHLAETGKPGCASHYPRHPVGRVERGQV